MARQYLKHPGHSLLGSYLTFQGHVQVNLMVTFEVLSSINMFDFCYVTIGPFLAEISDKANSIVLLKKTFSYPALMQSQIEW